MLISSAIIAMLKMFAPTENARKNLERKRLGQNLRDWKHGY